MATKRGARPEGATPFSFDVPGLALGPEVGSDLEVVHDVSPRHNPDKAAVLKPRLMDGC